MFIVPQFQVVRVLSPLCIIQFLFSRVWFPNKEGSNCSCLATGSLMTEVDSQRVVTLNFYCGSRGTRFFMTLFYLILIFLQYNKGARKSTVRIILKILRLPQYLNNEAACLKTLNSFPGMALWGGPPKGALYWGGHNLVNLPSLAPPLRLCVCT